MTRPDIDTMDAMVVKATEGPWRSQHNIDFPWDPGYLVYRAPTDGGPFGSSGDIGWQASEADADFIAAARTFVPEVIAYVRELKAEIENRNEIENEIAALIPESWDDDEAQIAIIERFVRHYAEIEEATDDEA